jgi:hypothetical protein
VQGTAGLFGIAAFSAKPISTWSQASTADLCGLSLYADQRPFFGWPFRIRTIAIIVFQLRVVAGTPNNLSTWPR